jgi:hypothetical protein
MPSVVREKRTSNETSGINYIDYKIGATNGNTNNGTLAHTTPLSREQYLFVPEKKNTIPCYY